MAFDLVNYFYDQTLQQHKGLLAESHKSQKESYLKHLIALQIYVLMDRFTKDTPSAYQMILNQDASSLHETSLKIINNNHDAQIFFNEITPKLETTNSKISQVVLAELLQLDQTAHLGQNGLKELITNQDEWIYTNMTEWFYRITNKPYMNLTKSNKKNSLDSTEITKEFSKILQQKSHNIAEDTHLNPIPLEEKTREISSFYEFLKPVIALIILYFLLNIIL